MSSRLIPPKTGAMSRTVSTIRSTSVVARQMGKASMPANSLNRSAFPSITGSAASGPIAPRPSIAVPSVTTATAFCLIVSVKTFSRSSLMARHTPATPGVYAIDRSSRVFTGTLFWMPIFPPRCIRKVRSETLTTRTPSTRRSAATMSWPWRSSRASMVKSRTITSRSSSTMSTAPMSPPASPMADVTRPSIPGRFRMPTRTVRL